MAFNPLCYCTVCPCDVLLSLVGFMCMDALYFLFLYFFTFTSTVFFLLCFFFVCPANYDFLSLFFFSRIFAKRTFSASNRQLFSGEMAEMTLCLCSQLNLHRSRREHRQMLTLHFSPDSICTGSTSARLFCLPNMRITSHLFIYEGANQLHRDSRAAGSAADPHGRNLSTIHPYCADRCISSMQDRTK